MQPSSIDPGAPTYSLDFLRKHPEISNESVPWHMHSNLSLTSGQAAQAVSAAELRRSRSLNRRRFIRSLSRTALVLPFADIMALAAPPQQPQQPRSGRRNAVMTRSRRRRLPDPNRRSRARRLGVSFIDVVKESGLAVKTIYGGEKTNKYLLETTGCGLAFYDYDEDGWLDVFLVNGWRLEGFPAGQEPRCHLFKNNRDGTFTDVTAGSGLEHKTGWGQACCVGDYNNDGHDDLFVTYYGQNALYRNQRQRHFHRRHQGSRLDAARAEDPLEHRLHALSITTKTDIWISSSPTMSISIWRRPPSPEAGPCTYKGMLVACGPPGLRRRQEYPVPQQRQRNLHRCQPESRHVDTPWHLRPERGGVGSG